MKASSGSGEWPNEKTSVLCFFICSIVIIRVLACPEQGPFPRKRRGNASGSKERRRREMFVDWNLIKIHEGPQELAIQSRQRKKQPPRESARRLNVSRKR